MHPCTLRLHVPSLVLAITLAAGASYALASEPAAPPSPHPAWQKITSLERLSIDYALGGDGSQQALEAHARAMMDVFHPSPTAALEAEFRTRSPERPQGASDEESVPSRSPEGVVGRTVRGGPGSWPDFSANGLAPSAGMDAPAISAESAGRTVTQTSALDYDGNGTIDIQRSITREYDSRGLPTRSVEEIGSTRRTTVFAYDDRGNLVESNVEYDADLDGILEFREHFSATYDQQGQKLEEVTNSDYGGDGTVEIRSSIRYEYDAQGHLTVQVLETDSYPDGLPDSRITITYTYGARGLVERSAFSYDYTADGAIDRQVTIAAAYDQRGNETLSVYQTDYEFDGHIDYRATVATTWDNQNNPVLLVAALDVGADGVVEQRQSQAATYDQQQDLIGVVSELDAGADGSIDYRETYRLESNAHGLPVRVVYEFDGIPIGSIDGRVTLTVEHDNRDNEVRNRTEVDLGADGVPEDLLLTETEYDAEGRIIGSEFTDDVGVDGVIDTRQMLTYAYSGSGSPPQVPNSIASGTDLSSSSEELQLASKNPFQDRSAFAFRLRRGADVELAIFDVRGRRVRTLLHGSRPAGAHRVDWDGLDASGRGVPNGAYFARLRTQDRVTTKVLVRAR